MKLCQQSKSSVESAIRKVVNHYSSTSGQTIVTDIHLQPNMTTGARYIFDDDDNELADTMINDWINYDRDAFYDIGESDLCTILWRMNDEDCLAIMTNLTLYAFVFLDDL